MYEVFYFLEMVVFRNVSLFHVLHNPLFFKLKKDLSFHFENTETKCFDPSEIHLAPSLESRIRLWI